MALKHLLACLALAAVANAQFYGHGDCPDVEVEHDFDLTKYAGIWYQYSFISPLEKGKCDTHEYIDNGNGTLTLKEFTIEEGVQKTWLGQIAPASDKHDGKLTIAYDDFGGKQNPYWVLGTDYNDFAVVWSCRFDGTRSRQTSWIITRERKPKPTIVAAANGILSKLGLTRALQLTEQEGC